MRCVQCPAEADPRDGQRSVFLAGGISNCPDWQSQLLEQTRLVRPDVRVVDSLGALVIQLSGGA